MLASKLIACMERAGEAAPVILPAEKENMGQRVLFEGEENL